MGTAFLFPGQGSQKLGMLNDVPKKYLKTCKEITGISLSETESCYQDTVFIQLALLVKAAFYIDELKKEEIYPDIVAGHSIGAFAAAFCCGALTFEETLFLVYHRANLMKNAYPNGFGMGVIVGLTRSEVIDLVKETFEENQPVYVSNENSPLQQTISGNLHGIEKTLIQAKRYQVQTAKLIRVPVPSHCLLMEETVERLIPYMEKVDFKSPNALYMKNTDGRSTRNGQDIKQDLLTNIAHPVQWNRIMDVSKELGTKIAIEFPPGDTLTKLFKGKFSEEIRTINLELHGIEDTAYLYHKWR